MASRIFMILPSDERNLYRGALAGEEGDNKNGGRREIGCPAIPAPIHTPPTDVESLSNQEEVELRARIEALGIEVTKVPQKPSKHLDELEIAAELDKLSAKLDDADKMISSAMAADPQVKSLLSSTADVWMPIITANADERRSFAGTNDESSHEEQQDLPGR